MNRGMKDIKATVVYLAEVKTQVSREEFVKRLDECKNRYEDTANFKPYYVEDFIIAVEPLDKQWSQQKMKELVEAQLIKLLDPYDFDEAKKYYNENIDCVDENWYLKTVACRIVDKLTELKSNFVSLKETGTHRSVWKQEYSRQKHDSETIERATLYISEIQAKVDQITAQPANEHNIDLAVYHRYIKELEDIKKDEEEQENALVKAVRRPMHAALSLQSIVFSDKQPLNADDLRLVEKWSSAAELITDHARISAREAEVCASTVYKKLYGHAEDISIEQIPNTDDQWEYADIATNGRWIDVKNSRRSDSSPKSYSEIYVKEFKKDRTHQEVIISAFLSPNSDDISKSIIWLGETTQSAIEELKKEFNSKYLNIGFENLDNPIFLPAWLFDYPAVCCENRNAAIEAIRSTGFVFPRRECDVACGLLAKRVNSSLTDANLNLEASKLERRIEASGLSRPVLFLHVLDRFCRSALDNIPFHHAGLDTLLFGDNKRAPLGVYDPLSTIWNLWEVLLKVSETCIKEALRFTTFHLIGPNILQGSNPGELFPTTIYAYCGDCKHIPVQRQA